MITLATLRRLRMRFMTRSAERQARDLGWRKSKTAWKRSPKSDCRNVLRGCCWSWRTASGGFGAPAISHWPICWAPIARRSARSCGASKTTDWLSWAIGRSSCVIREGWGLRRARSSNLWMASIRSRPSAVQLRRILFDCVRARKSIGSAVSFPLSRESRHSRWTAAAAGVTVAGRCTFTDPKSY
jgi:hypothetical protein